MSKDEYDHKALKAAGVLLRNPVMDRWSPRQHEPCSLTILPIIPLQELQGAREPRYYLRRKDQRPPGKNEAITSKMIRQMGGMWR